jgi:hypothetical protein
MLSEESQEEEQSDNEDETMDKNEQTTKTGKPAPVTIIDSKNANGSQARARQLSSSINYLYPGHKSISKHELKLMDQFSKMKDQRDWQAFCKLLSLYFGGVLALTQFFELFDEKFQQKLKPEHKEEIDRLLQTRDQQRRQHSMILKSWNDIEGYNFEKVPDQSYFKIDDTFPDPICTKKMTDPIYFQNINDKYLCVSTGSENKNCRNTNVENIYKAEDKLFEFDMQIDNIAKSLDVLNQQIAIFEALPDDQKDSFKL